MTKMNRIIQQKAELPNKDEWIFELTNVVTDLNALYQRLALDSSMLSKAMLDARKAFPLRVPSAFIDRMKKGDPSDPLLLQVICSADEMLEVDGYSADPLNEQNNDIPGLLHKYHNRALMMLKTGCAINCRYCFRRHFPYQENQSNKQNINAALNYIKCHPELDEIILSGGDPLMAKDHEMAYLINELDKIAHIKRLRIHSRLVVTIPSRVTESLCQLFKQSRLQILLVTHINHPNEIDQRVTTSMQKLREINVTLLNQSVLLKNINDESAVLVELSNKLFNSGILPYYLHLLDKVKGAAHFFVDDKTAKKLMRELAQQVSGYLVPKLAREISGESSKRIIEFNE